MRCHNQRKRARRRLLSHDLILEGSVTLLVTRWLSLMETLQFNEEECLTMPQLLQGLTALRLKTLIKTLFGI